MHIPRRFADCCFFLYDSEEDARSGTRSGGTGFLVSVPSTVEGYSHLYAITNKHVIDGGSCVLRLNTTEGGSVPIVTQPEKWIMHADGADVCLYDVALTPEIKFWHISIKDFVTDEVIDAYNIGYGDEAFLVGRLTAHAGKRKNAPVIRFGNVSLMADKDEPVRHKEAELEAFFIECRSISGFSGSPVFVTTTQFYVGEAAKKLTAFQQKKLGYDPSKDKSGAKITPVSSFVTNAGPWLLGIDAGHMPHWGKVVDRGRDGRSYGKTNYQAEINTGIAVVIPAWRILELVNLKEFVTRRDRDDKRLTKADMRKK